MHRPSITNPNAISDLSVVVPYIRVDRCYTDTIGEWVVPTPSYTCAITLVHSHSLVCIAIHHIQMVCLYALPQVMHCGKTDLVVVAVQGPPEEIAFWFWPTGGHIT